jgi:hypothetical protein
VQVRFRLYAYPEELTRTASNRTQAWSDMVTGIELSDYSRWEGTFPGRTLRSRHSAFAITRIHGTRAAVLGI